MQDRRLISGSERPRSDGNSRRCLAAPRRRRDWGGGRADATWSFLVTGSPTTSRRGPRRRRRNGRGDLSRLGAERRVWRETQRAGFTDFARACWLRWTCRGRHRRQESLGGPDARTVSHLKALGLVEREGGGASSAMMRAELFQGCSGDFRPFHRVHVTTESGAGPRRLFNSDETRSPDGVAIQAPFLQETRRRPSPVVCVLRLSVCHARSPRRAR